MKYSIFIMTLVVTIISLHTIKADTKDAILKPNEPEKIKKANKPKKVVKPAPIKKSKPAPKRYKLTVKTVPANATVKITNIKPKYKNGIGLVAGSYNIKVIKAGYETARRTIKIRNKNIIETIHLKKKVKPMKQAKPSSTKKTSFKPVRSSPTKTTSLKEKSPSYYYKKGIEATNRGNYSEAFRFHYKAASEGYAPSQNALGYMYQYGQGTTKNVNKSFEWYIKAANKGDAHAQWNIGIIHEKKGNITEAIFWYRKSAVRGNKKSKMRLKYLQSNRKVAPKPKSNHTAIFIPSQTKKRFPKLADCIARSKSMNSQERNYWYQVLPVMTSPQIAELIDILESENKKLLEIEIKYSKKTSSQNPNNYRRCR